MANNSSSKSLNLSYITGALSFFAILVKGALWFISWIIVDLLGGEFNAGILGKLADTCLIIAVFIAGWIFLVTHKLPGKKIVWQIVYIIITILALIGVFAV